MMIYNILFSILFLLITKKHGLSEILKFNKFVSGFIPMFLFILV